MSKAERRPKRTRRGPSVAIGTWPTPERPSEIGRSVRKRNGRLVKFDKSKIVAGVVKAGATRTEANRVANRISRGARKTDLCTYVRKRPEIASPTISSEVVSSLREVNRAAANSFVRYRDTKLREARRWSGRKPAASLKKRRRYAINDPEIG